MKVQVQKWGNSLALRPVESSIEQGALVDVSVVKGSRPGVAPVEDKKLTLEELLDGVTRRNIHNEIDPGSVWRESW